MRASDWRCVAEGGRHALFEYRRTAPPPPPLLPATPAGDGGGHWLLNLRKVDLARSEHWRAANGRNENDEEPNPDAIVSAYTKDASVYKDEGEDPFYFIREIVSTKLGDEYLEVPLCVSLSWPFVNQLRKQTLELDEIPPRRRQSWYVEHSEAAAAVRELSVTGRLVPNYTRWGRPSRGLTRQSLRHVDKAAAADCVAIEIKPKAGYTAVSPLVDPRRRSKYTHSRFVLLQRLYARGLVHKAWRTDNPTLPPVPSAYDPCDLFSGDADRVRAAVAALLAGPQNNLRIWCRRRLLVGVDRHGCEVPCDWQCLAECLQAAVDQVESTLVSAVSAILLQEALLQRLLELQNLDIIDGDGAILIYHRLVGLLGGSEEAAQELLDTYVAVSPSPPSLDRTGDELHPLLSHSTIQHPTDLSRINRFCQHVDHFRRSMLLQCGESTTDLTGLESARQSALNMVDSFDLHDCRFLLQNWLLSLAMNDLGVFIRCVRLEDAVACGTLRSSAVNTAEPGAVLVEPTTVLQYDMKVIDCDRKPASKLGERMKKEEIYNLLHSSNETV